MPGQRPLWAADILDCCTCFLKPRPMEIPNLIILARDPERWQWARVAFDDLRRMSLVMDRMPVREVFAHIFNLAEDVAKITYNASNPATPFDEKCQWRIVVTAWNIVQAMKEKAPDIDGNVWSVLPAGAPASSEEE